jgi:hypothetical protein
MVGLDVLAVSTVDGRVAERRVPLAARWLRGIAAGSHVARGTLATVSVAKGTLAACDPLTGPRVRMS